MGSGIAHVAALAGYEVTLVDRGQAEIDASLETIRTNLGRQARRGAITEVQRAAALGSIAPAVGLDAITGVDLVIEAVFEDEAVKKSIFAALRGALRSTPSSAPTARRSPSPVSRRAPTGPASSWACTS